MVVKIESIGRMMVYEYGTVIKAEGKIGFRQMKMDAFSGIVNL